MGTLLAQVIALVLDGAERYSSQAVDLHDPLRSGFVCDNVDIRFLSNTNLVSDRVDAVALDELVQREVIEAAICQSVSVIYMRSVISP